MELSKIYDAKTIEPRWYQYWKEARLQWHVSLGIPREKYRYHDHVKLAHYAKEACDIEYNFRLVSKKWKVSTPEAILT